MVCLAETEQLDLDLSNTHNDVDSVSSMISQLKNNDEDADSDDAGVASFLNGDSVFVSAFKAKQIIKGVHVVCMKDAMAYKQSCNAALQTQVKKKRAAKGYAAKPLITQRKRAKRS